MNILFASSEVHPLIKTGGLADVSASLPNALKRLGEDVRIVLPAYRVVVDSLNGKLKKIGEANIAGVSNPVCLLGGTLPGTKVPLILVDSPAHFDRAGDPYRATDGRDWQDNHLRFATFAKAIEQIALDKAGVDWKPDIVHCNDWQTGLVPALLSLHDERPATVFTIHNLAYQGLFPSQVYDDMHLPKALWSFNGLEFHGRLNLIKGGLFFADRITTVSPTYAREICTHQFGYGLEGLLNHRAVSLSGILNGIDYEEWNPATDPHLPAHYDSKDLAGKQVCKADIQSLFRLEPRTDIPLVAHIGRMVAQKGVDLIIDAFPPLIEAGRIQLVILGCGERQYEWGVRSLIERYPGGVGAHIGYDEAIAHRIEAGADIFLMPSRFEPCGLNQMYSLRYGTVPIVRRTGGLADTVVNADEVHLADGSATGISFDTPTAEALCDAVEYALPLYARPDVWQQIIRNGMEQDFSWERSAHEYLSLYANACK